MADPVTDPVTEEAMLRRLAGAIGGAMILRTSAEEIAAAALKEIGPELKQLRAALKERTGELDTARAQAAEAHRQREEAVERLLTHLERLRPEYRRLKQSEAELAERKRLATSPARDDLTGLETTCALLHSAAETHPMVKDLAWKTFALISAYRDRAADAERLAETVRRVREVRAGWAENAARARAARDRADARQDVPALFQENARVGALESHGAALDAALSGRDERPEATDV